MKARLNLELMVGVFMIVGILCLGYLSIKLGKVEVMGQHGYEVNATFSDTGGLRLGAAVVIAGVDVGRVKSIKMEDYEARVVLEAALHNLTLLNTYYVLILPSMPLNKTEKLF